MPDPLEVLPNEIWNMCIQFAIAGQRDGPLAFILVSHTWEKLLCDTPSLWSQIYIQNGEDEMARIFTFLHLSKQCSLHVDIMTELPTMDSLQLIAENISRATTISIRPGASCTNTVLNTDQWKQTASHILARLSNGLMPSNVETSCFGISLRENNQLYYRIILMHFTRVARLASANEQNAIAPNTSFRIWEEHIANTVRVSANQDSNARTDSMYAIAKLAPYAELRDAIRIAIPSFFMLMKDTDSSVRSAAIGVLCQLEPVYVADITDAYLTSSFVRRR